MSVLTTLKRMIELQDQPELEAVQDEFFAYGPEHLPDLLAALDDAQIRNHPRACGCLLAQLLTLECSTGHPRFAEIAQSDVQDHRELIAQIAGGLPPGEAAPLLKVGVLDPDRQVLYNASASLRQILKQHQDVAQLADQIFDSVCQAVLLDDKWEGQFARHLVQLDRERAAAFLTDPKTLAVERPKQLRNIVTALAIEEISIPTPQLLQLGRELLALGEPVRDALERMLSSPCYEREDETSLFDRLDEPEVGRFVEACSKSPVAYVQREAFALLLRRQGVPKPFRRVSRLNGWGKMNENQRRIAAIHSLWERGGSTGFEGYFKSKAGEHWKTARCAIEAFGLDDHLACFDQAVAVFGADGPPEDIAARRDIIKKIPKPDKAEWHDLSRACFNIHKQVVPEVCQLRFIYDNLDDFK